MFLDKFTVKDASQLPTDHPLYWLEDAIKAKVLPYKDAHDKEHEDMLLTWGSKKEHTSKLSIRIEDGVAFSDRLYHIMLHLRFWKDNPDKFPNLQEDYVNRFEQETGFNLGDLTLPKPSDSGESTY